ESQSEISDNAAGPVPSPPLACEAGHTQPDQDNTGGGGRASPTPEASSAGVPPSPEAAAAVAPQLEDTPPPDHVAGIMHSPAMAVVTQAAVSAVTTELHAEAAAAPAGTSAIEDLVNKVLERLK